MDKFYKEFYASRLDEWKNKYIKLLELRKLVKLIVKDIEKHGGKIERKNGRFSILEDSRNSIQLDRRSVGLSALEDKENLFNKNAPIFETPVMYEIENTFNEIEDLTYSDDIKIFLYFLNMEIYNVYVFYLSQEKEIYTRTNEHLYKRKNLDKMEENEVLEELKDLTDIAYLTYSFYLYADLNIEAIHQILKYFDEHFMEVNGNISLNKLYFNKYLTQNESDLKYILSFKTVIESTALLESYRKELIELYPNNNEIKTQAKELNDVLVYLISKNTDRVNEEIYEVYINSNKKGGVIKQKKNVDIDIQNSFFIDIHKADDYLKRLEELQYDKKMKIKMTIKNKINIIILFLYIFLNSLYFIIPYTSIYFNYKDADKKNDKKNKKFNHFEFLGIILASTHIGILVSRIIYSHFSKFKNAYIFYCICFLLSFIFIISSSFINLDKHSDDALFFVHTILFIFSRFFLGLSNERIITRKYLILFIPESQMRYFSLLFLLTSYIGLIAGATLIFFIDNIPKVLNNELNEFLLYIIGFGISFIHLLIILILFTEPNNEEGDMLMQILGIQEVIDGNPDEGLLKDDKSQVKIREKGPSINDQSKDFSDDLTFQENNKEMKIDNLDEEEKIEKEKVLSKDQLEGLNSIEKDIILMNQKNNFDDVNLVGNEIERIKKNQINNNKSFRKSFLAFVITLFLSNMINEYILIKTPFILEKVTDIGNKDKKWIVATTFILLLLSSFPLIVFCRIIKKFDIGRRYLLVIYFLIFITLIVTGVYKFKFNDEDENKQKPLLAIIFVTYLLNNCLEGITHLLIEKMIPSFAKFCGKNMKYLFSYFIHIGKAFGGISFFFFYLFLYENKKEKNNEKYFNIDNIESMFFITITFIFFIISLICYSSLRVRAFAKLRYYDD